MKALLFYKDLFMGSMHVGYPRADLSLPFSGSVKEVSFSGEEVTSTAPEMQKMMFRLVDHGRAFAIYQLDAIG